MKRVLFTGATGFIGRHCIAPLISKNYEIHAISTNPPDNRDHPVNWHTANLFDSEKVENIVKEVQPTHLLHLAWYTEPKLYWNSIENLKWVRASLNLIESFIRNNGQRVTIAGSCAEYDWNYGYCTENITPLNPSSLYGVCKNSLQSMTTRILKDVSVSNCWGRVFFLYGPGEPREKLVASVIRSLLDNKEVQTTPGDQVRDYLYVQDVADVFVRLLDSNIEGPVNIGSGKAIAIRDILDVIGSQMNKEKLILRGNIQKPDETPFLVANTRRINHELGWYPSYSLEKGIEHYIKWIEQGKF